MTDDFTLFQDQADGDPVDPDIALITAYLARELSIVQIAAVEDRLANDTAFREKTLPILEAWALPAAMSAPVSPALTREEVAAGWQRYVGDRAELDAHEGPRLVVEGNQPKRRRISMTRIAAAVAAVVLPVLTLAQVTVYVAKKPEAPGHSVAKQLVAPFTEPPVDVAPLSKPPAPLTTPVDVPVGKQIERKSPSVQRAEPARVPVTERQTPTLPVATPPVEATPRKEGPDRTRIAGYANKYMPELIRGDTNAAYVVMVLNASDDYVWGTYGSGALQIRIGGDKRTSDQRAEYNRTNAIELTGLTPRAPGARGGGGGGGFGVGAVPAGGGARGGGGGGRARGGVSDSVVARGALRADTLTLRTNDSLTRRVVSTSRVVFPDSALLARLREGSAARGGGAGVGGAAAAPTSGFISAFETADSSGAYSMGFGRIGANLNTAAGLQEPGNGESGIQGLKATSITMGEQYFFAPGQLTAPPLRIFVFHLAPGTSWKGR
jgi:hypothetical protein